MPDTQPSLELYALALALVPDETEAGDIFMAARDEDHLCRLAAQWRERHGLPYLANPPSQPTLTEDQTAYGLHLVRRRERRRRSGLVLAALAVVLLIVGVRTFAHVPMPGISPQSDRAAKAGPTQAADEVKPLALEVLRTEATPGGVTVSWKYTGAQGDLPVLILGDSTIVPDRVESRRGSSSGWFEGSSTYTVVTAGQRSARLEIRQRGTDGPLVASEPFELTRVVDLAARVIERETVLLNYGGMPVGKVTEVVLGANYTMLKYWGTAAVAKDDTLEVKADGVPLEAYGDLKPIQYLSDGQQLVFGPVPPGTRTLVVTPRESATFTGVGTAITPGNDEVTWNGGEVKVVVEFPLAWAGPWERAELLDEHRSYQATVRELERTRNGILMEFRSDQVPSGATLLFASVRSDRRPPGIPVTIELS